MEFSNLFTQEFWSSVIILSLGIGSVVMILIGILGDIRRKWRREMKDDETEKEKEAQ